MIKNLFKPKKSIDTKVVVNIDDDKLKDIVIQTIKERELEKEKQAKIQEKKSKKPLYQIGDTITDGECYAVVEMISWDYWDNEWNYFCYNDQVRIRESKVIEKINK